ncbi:GIDE domain-containing protein [Halorussus caseinilyticus]|uniref:RING-type E3 ubiquitin transferase n=1 Tax=Halorussus caseinilyticus TaxID=3034025 RepID=A0ABD5WNY0_9EURY|nr:GIDE domain-containing protein [Halorussus sp. DT72]
MITVLGSVFLLAGVAFGWYGLRPLAVVARLVRAETVGPASVSAADEFVVCRGRAQSVGDSLTAPFTGEKCLGLEYEISERELTPSEIPFTWTRLDDGVATVPFELRDDRGRVRVDPDPRRFRLDTESETVTVPAGDDPPERIRSFVAARGDLSPTAGGLLAPLGIGTRRYTERRIDPGEVHVVAGRPERRDGRVVLADPAVIADESPRTVARRRLRASAFPLVAAVAACVVGGGLLAVA